MINTVGAVYGNSNCRFMLGDNRDFLDYSGRVLDMLAVNFSSLLDFPARELYSVGSTSGCLTTTTVLPTAEDLTVGWPTFFTTLKYCKNK